MHTLSHIGIFFIACGFLGGCSINSDSDPSSDESDVAAKTELTAKADGITVWVDSVAHPLTRFDQPAWSFDVRASKDIESVFSFSSDDEFGEAIQTSKRKFQVFVDGGQMEHLLAGYHIIVDLKAAAGAQKQYFVAIEVAPRLERFQGSSKITLRKTFTPFSYDSEIRFRNLVGVAAGFGSPGAATAGGAQPVTVSGEGTNVAMDWLAPALLEVAGDPTRKIDVSATSTAAAHRFGGVDLVVTSFQASTTSSPLTVFRDPACAPAVLECVKALPADELDRSSCGEALEVLPCLWQLTPH